MPWTVKKFFKLMDASILAAILFNKVNPFITGKWFMVFYLYCRLTLNKIPKFSMESNFNKIMDYANKRSFNQCSNQEIKTTGSINIIYRYLASNISALIQMFWTTCTRWESNWKLKVIFLCLSPWSRGCVALNFKIVDNALIRK